MAKVKLQIMIEDTLKNDFIKTCEQVGLDMSEVVRMKIFEFIKENKKEEMSLEEKWFGAIEHLQEMNKVIVDDEDNILEMQRELSECGYDTEIVNSDRTYLKLI